MSLNSPLPKDIFDSSLSLEEQHISDGRADGVRAGRKAGLLEGRELGVQKGFEIGHEVGFYAGCVLVLKQAVETGPATYSARVTKAVQALDHLTSQYPLDNPQDERLQDMMLEMRGKYKTLAAMLGLHNPHSTGTEATATTGPAVDLTF